MTTPIRLVQIITDLQPAGAEIMLLRLLQHIDRTRFDPQVISLTSRGKLGSKLEDLRIPVLALGMRPGRPDPVRFLRLTALIRKLQPDIVHTWMYHSDLLGGGAAYLAGVRRIAWGLHHSDLSREHTKRMTRMVVAACARLSGRVPRLIHCCSQASGDIHVALGYPAEKMRFIPNGFDLDVFAPDASARASVRAELGIDNEVPLVGLIGRFDPQKNHEGFLGAARLVLESHRSARFLLAGTGVVRSNSELHAMLKAAGTISSTHLLGVRDDIPRVMAALDVCVSAACYGEAFPLVLGEAMSSGVPCVTTDVGDSSYLLGDTGRVVPPGDRPAMAHAISDLLSDGAEKRAERGTLARNRIQKNFDMGVIVKRYESFYEELRGK